MSLKWRKWLIIFHSSGYSFWRIKRHTSTCEILQRAASAPKKINWIWSMACWPFISLRSPALPEVASTYTERTSSNIKSFISSTASSRVKPRILCRIRLSLLSLSFTPRNSWRTKTGIESIELKKNRKLQSRIRTKNWMSSSAACKRWNALPAPSRHRCRNAAYVLSTPSPPRHSWAYISTW